VPHTEPKPAVQFFEIPYLTLGALTLRIAPFGGLVQGPPSVSENLNCIRAKYHKFGRGQAPHSFGASLIRLQLIKFCFRLPLSGSMKELGSETIRWTCSPRASRIFTLTPSMRQRNSYSSSKKKHPFMLFRTLNQGSFLSSTTSKHTGRAPSAT
jgi:hypothetical protein